MCGGGGSAPEPVDPLRQAEADLQVLRQQYELDRQMAEAEYQRQREQEALEREQWGQDLARSRTATQSSIEDLFSQRGLDPTEYGDRIGSALDRAEAGIAFGANPTFGSDIGTDLLDSLRNEQIKQYQRGINEFAPEGFAQQAFASTADDAIIDAILAEQFGEASDSILRARDRGTLNDAGFDYAMKNLEQQRAAAASRLQDTGGGILEGYRSELGDIVERARTGAGGWDFGDTFDPNVYRTQLETRQNELASGLEGALRGAIGGEQFFNTADLIQKGGVGQGAQNTGLGSQSGGLLGAIADRKKQEEQQRGLGTTGSF
jgi:hypothetical protein